MSSKLIKEAKKFPEDNGCFELTEAQKQELDRRIQGSLQNPQAGRGWEDIKSEFLNQRLIRFQGPRPDF